MFENWLIWYIYNLFAKKYKRSPVGERQENYIVFVAATQCPLLFRLLMPGGGRLCGFLCFLAVLLSAVRATPYAVRLFPAVFCKPFCFLRLNSAPVFFSSISSFMDFFLGGLGNFVAFCFSLHFLTVFFWFWSDASRTCSVNSFSLCRTYHLTRWITARIEASIFAVGIWCMVQSWIRWR